MHWGFVLLAGFLEAFWPIALKETAGFTRLYPSIFTVLVLGVSLYLLSLAMKVLEPSIAYIVFIGVGSIGVLLVDILILNQSISLKRILFVLMIIIGVVGLYYSKAGE